MPRALLRRSFAACLAQQYSQGKGQAWLTPTHKRWGGGSGLATGKGSMATLAVGKVPGIEAFGMTN